MKENSQDYAFPVMTITGGLTKREYYASLCMQGLISNSANKASDFEIARVAVVCADALIKELNK